MSQQKIEKWVSRLVAKPLSLVLYGSWLAGCFIGGATKRGVTWLQRRLARRSIGTVGAGGTK